jgi:hypothetical protein
MEWIEFTALMGAGSFTVYDHASRDGAELARVLAAYTGPHAAGSPRVEVVAWPPRSRAEGDLLAAQRHWAHAEEADHMRDAIEFCRGPAAAGAGHPIGCQIAAKADCFARHMGGGHHDFVSFHDTDEFIFSLAPGGVPGALAALRAHHPRVDAFYLPSITFGSMQLRRIPEGQLVVETFTRRAPFDELGDDAAAVAASIANCSKPARSFPSRTLCTVDHGKHVFARRPAVFLVGPTLHATQEPDAFMDRFQHAAFTERALPRSGPVCNFHYQHRGLADLAARGRLWGKALNLEQALRAPGFWGAVEDTTLAGNATLVGRLRRNIAARLRAAGGGE